MPVTGGEPDWSAEWTAGKTTTAERAGRTRSRRAPSGEAAPPGPEVAAHPARRSRPRATRCTRTSAPSATARPATRGPVSRRIGAPSLADRRGPGRTPTATSTASSATAAASCPATATRCTCPSDRWAIVNHVRKLQAQTPAARSRPAPPRRSRRRRARPAPPEGASMSPTTVHARLVERAVAGRYDLFLGLGRRARDPRPDPLRPALSRRRRRPRLAAVPRQLALLHRARRRQRRLRGGAEDRQRQVVRAGDPVRRGVGGLPAGLAARPGADLHRWATSRSTGRWSTRCTSCSTARRSGSRTGSCSRRLVIGLARALLVGWQLVRADLLPDMFATRGACAGGPARRCSTGGPGTTTARRRARGARGADPPAGADLRGALRARVHHGGVRRHHGAPAALVLQPAGRLLLHGLVPGRAHAAGADDDLRRVATSASPTWSRPSSGTTSASSASASPCSGPT